MGTRGIASLVVLVALLAGGAGSAAALGVKLKLCVPDRRVHDVPANPTFLVRAEDVGAFSATTAHGRELALRVTRNDEHTRWVTVEVPAGIRFTATGYRSLTGSCGGASELRTVRRWRPVGAPRTTLEGHFLDDGAFYVDVDWTTGDDLVPVKAEWAFTADELRLGRGTIEFLSPQGS